MINFFSPVLMRAFGGGEEAIQYGRCLGRDIHLVLLPAGLLPLHGGNLKRRGKIHGAHVRHDDLLVHHPGKLYQHHGPVHSGYQGDLLGLSADLGVKLRGISDSIS